VALPLSSALQSISVHFDYPVHFTRGCLDPGNPRLVEAIVRREPARRHRVAVIVDGGVADATPALATRFASYVASHAASLELVAPPMVVPGGEDVKNDPAIVLRVQSWLNDLAIDRQSVVLIAGGGAVLDMAGYAAATTHRGVRVVRLPTTVLSQGDSGVGVKNGVNAFGKKNFLGSFSPPFAVINDLAFLDTLPLRDRVAGMAEAVKVSLVRDPEFFQWISTHAQVLAQGDAEPLGQLVARSAELHLEHIRTAGDPFELGSSRPLDFGHWAAHRLETLTEHRLRHGECVAIGMAIDALYSAKIGLCTGAVAESVVRVLSALGFALWDDALDMTANGGRLAVLAGLAEFREHLGGELTITLLSAIGSGVEVHEMREDDVLEVIAELKRRAARTMPKA
jgi:3-dehydroquinate synthase